MADASIYPSLSEGLSVKPSLELRGPGGDGLLIGWFYNFFQRVKGGLENQTQGFFDKTIFTFLVLPKYIIYNKYFVLFSFP